MIHCFEPEPRNLKLLRENIIRNKLRAKVYRLAVSDTCRCARLQLSGSVSHTLSDLGESSVPVECVDLAKVMELTGVDRFDFSKIDIEGSEKEILDGATEDQLRRLGTMSMEWHGTNEQMHPTAKRLGAMGLKTQWSASGGRYLKAWKID
jgi:FkbM family methyltransferase